MERTNNTHRPKQCKTHKQNIHSSNEIGQHYSEVSITITLSWSTSYTVSDQTTKINITVDPIITDFITSLP
jgi:hypothetical protein